MLPSFQEVVAASARIRDCVVKTPILESATLNERASRRLIFKAENLQVGGAFKARGAANAALQGSGRTLVTYSSGNHGLAVARMARQLNVGAVVVMPEDASPIKVSAVAAIGGEVVFAGRTTDDRRVRALAIAAERGGEVIAPFDDARVIAGQGTAILELIDQAAELGVALDAILVPVGGGGLLAGACLARDGARSAPAIVAVEPSLANAFQQSLAAGQRVRTLPSRSIADGLRPVQVGELPFEIARRHVELALDVSEEAIATAVLDLLFELKVLVEPSGACGLAGALLKEFPRSYRNVGILLSGGNVAPPTLAGLISTR